MLAAILCIGVALWWIGHGLEKTVEPPHRTDNTTVIYNDNRTEHHTHYHMEVSEHGAGNMGDTSQREFVRR